MEIRNIVVSTYLTCNAQHVVSMISSLQNLLQHAITFNRATFDVVFRVIYFPNLVAGCDWTLDIVQKHVHSTCNNDVMFSHT
jgi:hypothetical protein